jgi:hypothetical protein
MWSSMAPKSSMNKLIAVLAMHMWSNLSIKTLAILGIFRSTYSDIVQRFGETRDLKDKHSYGRPWFPYECGDIEIVWVINDPSNDTTTDRELESQGLGLNNDIIRKSFQCEE